MKEKLCQQPQGRTLETSTNNPFSKHISDITLVSTLSYLNQILLEEDLDERDILPTNESALYAMEKPLYDILGQKYPPASSMGNTQQLHHTSPNPNSTNHVDFRCSQILHQHSSNLGLLSAAEYNKGFDEGIKFLPTKDKLVQGTEAKKLPFSQVPQEDDLVDLNPNIDRDKKREDFMGHRFLNKKRADVNLDVLEGRMCKISMSYSEEPPRSEMFDEVLLDNGNYTEVASLQECIQNKTNNCCEVDQLGIDHVRGLLIECSNAVYSNDRQLAEGLINKIRKVSSLDGNGTQRMASAFADALEARLNGTGSEAWRRIATKHMTTSEYIKLAQLYITVCPFPGVSIHYANQTILKAVGKASKLHIIDFGIGFGFQWPSLIQALSNNSNCKSIKLKITGIDFPLAGFRPAERIQETGRRLEAYAESFGVPFEYQGIASKWEDVSLDDLTIKEEEVLIVYSMYRFREIGDEAVSLDSPRNRVLDLIRQIKPNVFIQGIMSIRAFSPFFISRFKQALVLYSTLYDIIDTLIPRENKQRQLIERCILARDILNVLACEGSDWIMKPESYKQWHLRNLRAGLEQIPLDLDLLKDCKEKMKKFSNNNRFFIDEDKNWLLLCGIGGGYNSTISTWKA